MIQAGKALEKTERYDLFSNLLKKKKKIRNFKGIVRKLKEKIKEGKELLKNRKAFLKADVTYFAIWPP